MRIIQVVKPTKITTQVGGEVQVTLTLAEAVFLRSVLSCVGGEPRKTPRCYADSILKGLRECHTPDVNGVFDGPAMFATMPLEDFDRYAEVV